MLSIHKDAPCTEIVGLELEDLGPKEQELPPGSLSGHTRMRRLKRFTE